MLWVVTEGSSHGFVLSYRILKFGNDLRFQHALIVRHLYAQCKGFFFLYHVPTNQKRHPESSGRRLTLSPQSGTVWVFNPMRVYTNFFLALGPRYSGRVRVPNSSLDGEGSAQLTSKRPYNKLAQNSSLDLFFCFCISGIPNRH